MGEKPATRNRNSSEPIEPKTSLAPITEATVIQQASPTASPAAPSKPVERSREEQLSRRKYVFDELIETEEHYVNDLKILVRVCSNERSARYTTWSNISFYRNSWSRW